MSDILFDNLVFDRLREIGDQSQWIGGLESEIARLRLTDEEREAVADAICIMSDAGWGTARLRNMLDRLSPPAT